MTTFGVRAWMHTRVEGPESALRCALRVRRVRFLRGRGAPGRRLFTGGAYPQGMYGVQQFGLSPTALRTLRRQAARDCSTLGQGRCLTSLLPLEMGTQDPAKRVVGDVLELWIDIWLHLTDAQRKRGLGAPTHCLGLQTSTMASS